MQKTTREQEVYGQSTTNSYHFIDLEKVGEGSFSEVWKVRRITDDSIYALKKIRIRNLKDKEKQNALNEIRILASLNSPYIVQYRQAFYDHKLNLLCIVMEYANGGDLQKIVEHHKRSREHIPENEIWKAAYHIIRGLDILHSNAILHRDIKSANIFINGGVYKLGDLNVSKVQDSASNLAETQTGTPYYASPEIWRDEPYDSKSDIWSLGCVLYEMCTFRPPFRGKDLDSLYHSVQAGFYQPIPTQYSQSLGDLINICLRANPKHRLSCKQLLFTFFKKQWFQFQSASKADEPNVHLLKTIKLPTDLKDLKRKLPKSNYGSSIDQISYKNDPSDSNEQNQFITSGMKKYSHHDYFLQLAKKKQETQYQNAAKINRVISEASAYRNPEENETLKKNSKGLSPPIMQGTLSNNKKSNKVLRIKPIENSQNQVKQKASVPCSDRSRQKKIERRYLLPLKIEEGKTRKFSHDQQSQRANREALNNLGLIKKLSQASSVNNCHSQKYLKSELTTQKSLNSNHIQTQRYLKNEKLLRKLELSKKNEQLMEIQKKVEQKRKELRKIGSIQRLQAGSHKNIHNLSYRPAPSIVLQSNIKKSAAHVSNILLKSPESTQEEPNTNSMRAKQKSGSHKRLILNSQISVSPIPYMVGIGDTPRMKRMLENLNEIKKNKESELKTKIMSSRYLPYC